MGEEKTKARPVFWGTCIAVGIGLVGVFIMAVTLYLTPLSDTYCKPLAIALYIIGAFVGGFIGARKAEGKRLLCGIEVGLCYFCFVTLLSFLVAPAALSPLKASLKAVYTLLSSASGAVVGTALGE